jgi:hypothetical protein
MDEQHDFAESVPSSKLRRADRLAYDYRLFYLDADRRIERRMDLKFHSDSDAISHVKTIGSRHGMELWQGKRMVREFLPGE